MEKGQEHIGSLSGVSSDALQGLGIENVDGKPVIPLTQNFINSLVRRVVEAKQTITAMESALEEAHELARIDELTRIPNRRAFQETLEKEIGRRLRYKSHAFSLLLIDVDHFKKVNDTYGHLAGDRILRQLGSLFASITRTRSGDMVSRYGGEEFACIGQETNGNAVILGEKLRNNVETEKFSFNGTEVPVTVSIGISTFWPPKDEDDKIDWEKIIGTACEDLVAKADEALYSAKNAGRNQAWIFDLETQKPRLVTEEEISLLSTINKTDPR